MGGGIRVPRSLGDIARAATGRSDPLSPLIDKYFLTRDHSHVTYQPQHLNLRRGGRFTPSSCGPHKCLRAGVFQFMQVPKRERRDPEQQLIFHVGDATHLMWYGIFLDMERVLGSDVFRVVQIEGLVGYPPLFLAGWFDAHVEIHGVPYLIDLKTINDSGYTHRRHSSPDPAHVGQLVRYLRSRRVGRGLLVYLNKNDQRWKVFPIRYRNHKAEWHQTVKWLRRGIKALEERRVPPMDSNCTKGSPMAKDCPWRHLCYRKSPTYIHAITFRNKPDYRDLWEETTGNELAKEG